MMSSAELVTVLSELRLSQAEASQLLGVSARTLRRWQEGEDVPGPAEAALRAWRVLDRRHLPWKPDTVSILENDTDQIERYRRHSQEMAQLVQHVEARGGARNRWSVDLANNKATFGPFEIGFYRLLQEGGFSLSTYRRKDANPDVTADAEYIQDAAYCISEALKKAHQAHAALRAVAKYTRDHASSFAQGKARPVDPVERKRAIVEQAAKIDGLAALALEGRVSHLDFDGILSELHALGFFPEISLISHVAQALVP